MAAPEGLPSFAEIEAFSNLMNSFYILRTDVIPTFGLTFSQIGIRLYRVEEEEVHIGIPCPSLFANALGCIENARQGAFPETPDKRKALDKLCKAMLKFSKEQLQGEVTRLKKLDSESKVNLHIADTFLMALIDGQCVVNASHGKDAAIAGNGTVITPDKAGWKGLGIGNWKAWYGELDMIVRPSGASATAVAHKMELDEDDGSPGKSVAVEGKIKSTGDTLEGCRFSQVVSSAITFSFVYQSHHKDRESLIPTIQVSKDGFDAFFYDCKEDILIGQLFGWTRVSLIFLWTILNYRLFPPQIPSTYSTYQFGYRNSESSGKGFLNLQEGEFYYGECIHSSSPFREPYSRYERRLPVPMVCKSNKIHRVVKP